MKKAFIFILIATFLTFTAALPQASAQAADGTHSVNYQVNQPDSNSASIANDYFLKPAKVTIKNGTATVQITLKNSAWITEFQPPGGATVLSENKAADTRVVQFTVKDLTKPVKTAMKIDVDDINYHHSYTVALVFDAVPEAAPPATSGASTTTVDKTTSSQPPSSSNSSSSTKGEGQVTNPQTSDSTPYLLILALVGSAFLLYKTRFKTKQGEQ